ncbi:MAG: dihydroorotate dehydrogenase electron transfer subunit [Deltaproteobacteria bacterium]|nr:dihydroorotate dehydrogenase electron transfer subunit [Deltaproteobacteria bacterium]
MREILFDQQVQILSNRFFLPGHCLMVLRAPLSYGSACPGQFIMLILPGRSVPFLPRPFCIYGLAEEPECVRLEILYRVTGEGTDSLSRLHEGDKIGLLGPLGRGFDIDPAAQRVVLVAGGMGIAPLMRLAQAYRFLLRDKEFPIICYLGAAAESHLIGRDRMEALRADLRLSTDDGSTGHRGFITELFAQDLPSYRDSNTMIYACGPLPMLKTLAHCMIGSGLSCQVSLEERMACGVGACLGCVVALSGEAPGIRYGRVCTEGPVFSLSEIDWSVQDE